MRKITLGFLLQILESKDKQEISEAVIDKKSHRMSTNKNVSSFWCRKTASQKTIKRHLQCPQRKTTSTNLNF